MKHTILSALAFGALSTGVYASSFGDIYAPVGNGSASCTTEISSLMRTAYSHYPTIRAAENMILGAGSRVKSAEWGYYPTPSVEVSQRSGQNAITARIDQPLWTGGKLDAMSDKAYAQQEEALNALSESGYALAQRVLDVLRVYIQSEGEIRANTEGKEQLKSMTEMLKRRVDAGVSSESDSSLIDARIAQIDADLMMSKSRFAMAKSQLEFLTGKPLNCKVAFAGDRVVKQNVPVYQIETEMLQTHPVLKKMESQIKIANAELKGADAAMMPNVSLRAEHQRGSLYSNVDSGYSDTLVYVAVSMSPGAGLSAISNAESAKYNVFQLKDEKNTKEQELKDYLVTIYADYSAALGRIESLNRNIDATQKVFDSYSRLFLAGKRQWLDLVNISREVTQSKLSIAVLRAIYISSAYQLNLLRGQAKFNKSGK